MAAIREAIIDAAVELAEEQGWEAVRLYEVAQRLGVSLLTLSRYFREKDEIIDAWFDRADEAMLAVADRPGFTELTPRQRVHRLIMAYLERLGPHRRVTREMVGHKLEFGHLHVQIPAVLRISRTVQWLREAAHRDAAGAMRGLEETVLTSIFVTTFVSWLNEDTHDFRRTRARLSRLLHGAAWMAQWVPGYHSPRPRGALPAPPQGALRPENVADESTDARA